VLSGPIDQIAPGGVRQEATELLVDSIALSLVGVGGINQPANQLNSPLPRIHLSIMPARTAGVADGGVPNRQTLRWTSEAVSAPLGEPVSDGAPRAQEGKSHARAGLPCPRRTTEVTALPTPATTA
jgi:hypothetical protein